MTTLYNRAIAAIPGVPELDAALDTVKAQLAAPVEVENSLAIEAEIADTVLAGNPWPADVSERLAARARRVATAEEERALMKAVRMRLENRRDLTIEAGTDDALAVVADELAEVMADARAVVPQIGATRSIEQAVDRGDDVLAAWLRLRELADRYRAVRTTQWSLIRNHTSVEAFRMAGHIRGLDTVWHPAVNDAVTDERTATAPPWPSSNLNGDPEYGPTYLIWLVESGLAPWVPTLAELEKEAELQAGRVQARARAERKKRQLSPSQQRALELSRAKAAAATTQA